jgi:pimeloyl-ACP methyl ester carboxylesterase
MGSELHDAGEKLWEPESEQDVLGLYLDQQGKSVSNTVTATDAIRTFDAIANVDLYKSFLDDLAEIDTAGTIDAYVAGAYDWRLSIPDIIAQGTLEAQLRQLAATSHTDKVMIVAHSNGGLVAKALLNELGPEASVLVDKLVLVGVPQLGTPQAIAALLHGADASVPFSFSEARARDFAKNAPFAYHLLPHQDYYANAGVSVGTPYVSFAPDVPTEFISAYGSSVDSGVELRDFILGTEGRPVPLYADLEHPSQGNQYLFDSAVSYLSAIGANWTPPEGIEVHQIAGVGEDTLAGITYKPSKVCVERYVSQTSTPTCLRYEPSITFETKEVIDGDGTVVEPSALAISDANSDVKRHWLNLNEYNQVLGFVPLPAQVRTQHATMFEVGELNEYVVNSLLANEVGQTYEYLSSSVPTISKGDRLKFTLHSPLALTAEDSLGRVVAEDSATLPGASYKRYGDVQVIWVPKDVNPTVKLLGEAEGSFTLDVEEYSGDTQVSGTSFVGIPSTVGTIVTLPFPDGTIENADNLVLDYNGDGTGDVQLTPAAGGEVALPKLDLTVTADSKIIKLGESLPVFTSSISGLPPGVVLDGTDITGAPECTTTATPTSQVGAYPITCTAGTLTSDYYKFEDFVAGTLTISYTWSGFQQPIDDPATTPGITPSIFKAGSTIPVKFKLRDANGNIVQATVLPQWLTPTRGTALTGAVDEPVYSDPATTGNTYRYDPTAQQYIYNWKTAKTDAGYWYKIYVKLDDGTIKSVMIGLK